MQQQSIAKNTKTRKLIKMSDPFRDHMANKRSEKREKIREEYTPLVIWVKAPEGKRAKDIYSWITEKINSMPFVTAATSNVPYKYATDGAIREEKADGNSEKSANN